MDLKKLLDPMGSPVASYRGTATLQLESGKSLVCDFAARQTTAGDVLIAAEPEDAPRIFGVVLGDDRVVSLKGETRDGARIESEGSIFPQDLPPEEGTTTSSWFSLRVPELTVTRDGVPAEETRFGLTNVKLPSPGALSLKLDAPTGPSEARLRRLKDGRSRYQRAKAIRGVEVTSELVFDGQPTQAKTQAAEDVAYLLSIAQGSVVQWLYCDEYAGGSRIRRRHRNRKTQEYAPIPTVKTARPKWPEEFVEATYPTYTQRRDDWQLDRGPIDWYLEAKIEADYLEPRGAKLALALETLKHRYLHSTEAAVSEHVVPPAQFEKIAPDLESEVATYLNANTDLDDPAPSKIAGKVRGLNRESFRKIVVSLLDLLDLNLDDKELAQFIDSRNCLVHQGQFYCQSVEKGEAVGREDPLESVSDEYFLMVNTLDRIFLSLVGYDGEHRDWTAFPDEESYVPLRP